MIPNDSGRHQPPAQLRPTYQPRHLAATPPNGLQTVREQRAVLAIRHGQQQAVLHGRHRTWDRWPLQGVTPPAVLPAVPGLAAA